MPAEDSNSLNVNLFPKSFTVVSILYSRTGDSVRISLSPEETVVLPSEKYALMKLGEGTVIKKERLLELKRIEEIHRAKQKGLRLLDRRSYSAAQLKAKLEEDLFSPEAIEEVLKGFSSHNYINDDRFAQDLITAELKRKPIGRRFLYQRLLHKGIKRTTALQMIEAGYSIEQEEELCEKLMEKLIRKRGTDIKKIFPTLARRGFGGPLIKKVFERLRKKK